MVKLEQDEADDEVRHEADDEVRHEADGEVQVEAIAGATSIEAKVRAALIDAKAGTTTV